jgi:hypothetical protein
MPAAKKAKSPATTPKQGKTAMTTPKKSFFHFDGTINLALLVLIASFVGGIVLWALKMDTRLTTLELDRIELRTDMREIKSGLRDLSIDVATIRGRMAENTMSKK